MSKQLHLGLVGPGQVAVVTGASSGIGMAIARELASAGMHVYSLARSLPDFFGDPSHHRSFENGFIRPICIDVNDEPALLDALNKIVVTEGHLECLVQAAGFGIAGAVEDTSAQEARQQLKTNFFGAMHALPFTIRQMRLQRRGLIVQIGSVAGALPIPFQAYYSASKAALSAITLALANEVEPWGVRCMLVQPGDTRTGFTKARVMACGADLNTSAYAERCKRSVEKMAKDEKNGVPPETVARQVVSRMRRRRPPLVFTPGMTYQALLFLTRIVPLSLIRRVIARMYAG